mmetsp:Transcript_106653/g.318811  ORF Transcript_106653/g.318811 Transcript_106653/m.318811 type:complete len:551 (-) Transcript_106653:52-1704(-)
MPDASEDEERGLAHRPPRGSPDLAGRRRYVPSGQSELGPTLAVDLSAVVLVCIVNFMDSLGGSISTPILPFYGRRFGATYEDVGKLFSAFALAQMLSLPLLAYLSDRFGRRTVLLLSLLGTSAGSLWQGLAGSYTSLLAARAFSGIWAGVSSVCQVYIADVVPAELRPSYMSYFLSSTQAATLFGPSIGAGLSVLGLNVPILTQAAVSLAIWPIVLVHVPESPEWLRLRTPSLVSPHSPSHARERASTGSRVSRTPTAHGLGGRGTALAIVAFGGVALWSMMAQMAIVSMYGVFAETEFGLDSLHVGFATSLGAIASVITSVWISPCASRRLGNIQASMAGSLCVAGGALAVLLRPLRYSLLGLLTAYQGMAINASAVACGAAELTDAVNRATVMTGVRVLKSLGAVLAPVISGRLAGMDHSLPFYAAASMAMAALMTQLFTMRTMSGLAQLLKGRRAVGLSSGLLSDEGWQDEYGTPEEIRDLGLFVADLLTTRHYRWVTYNKALKQVLSNFFPPLPIESDQEHREGYDWVRDQARGICSQAMMVQERS